MQNYATIKVEVQGLCGEQYTFVLACLKKPVQVVYLSDGGGHGQQNFSGWGKKGGDKIFPAILLVTVSCYF